MIVTEAGCLYGARREGQIEEKQSNTRGYYVCSFCDVPKRPLLLISQLVASICLACAKKLCDESGHPYQPPEQLERGCSFCGRIAPIAITNHKGIYMCQDDFSTCINSARSLFDLEDTKAKQSLRSSAEAA